MLKEEEESRFEGISDRTWTLKIYGYLFNSTQLTQLTQLNSTHFTLFKTDLHFFWWGLENWKFHFSSSSFNLHSLILTLL